MYMYIVIYVYVYIYINVALPQWWPPPSSCPRLEPPNQLPPFKQRWLSPVIQSLTSKDMTLINHGHKLHISIVENQSGTCRHNPVFNNYL